MASQSLRPPIATYAEAALTMIVASAMIRLIALRRLAPKTQKLSAVPGESELYRLRRAIDAWSRRLPWRTMCFEQGLTAHWMLRRRGMQSTLYYGAAVIDGVLKAHVWVRSGEVDVIGCENASDYALLASFPDR